MKKMKLATIIATVLILVGGIVFALVMTAYGWDFAKLTTVKYETDTYVYEEKIENLSLKSSTADITVLQSTDGKTKVVTYLPKDEKHSVKLDENTLIVEIDDGFNWSTFFSVNFKQPKITVYLPEEEYVSLNIKSDTSDVKIARGMMFDSIYIKVSTGDVKCDASANADLKIKASTGDIRVSNVLAGSINITTSTGDINLKNVNCIGDIKTEMSTGDAELTNVKCKNLKVNGDTGDVELKNVIANENFNIRTDTGDVELSDSDAQEIYIESDTGDVEGTLLSEKVFIARSDTGDIKVPSTTSGGKCEITTDTGDIKIKIK